jgi:hypothetical protein
MRADRVLAGTASDGDISARLAMNLRISSTEDTKNHSTAEPQPNSTSAAKADRRKLRFGRAEARPSE